MRPEQTSTLEVFGPSDYVGSARDAFWQKHRRQVTFADPAAWCLVGAAAPLLEKAGDVASEGFGSMLLSSDGPEETRREIIKLSAKGQLSPMRFPAATPSALLAPTLIIYGLRGPSLNFTVAARAALPVVGCVASQWFKNFHLEAVLFATVTSKGGAPTARALVIKILGRVPSVDELVKCLAPLHSQEQRTADPRRAL
jgi:hypothetical protein